MLAPVQKNTRASNVAQLVSEHMKADYLIQEWLISALLRKQVFFFLTLWLLKDRFSS